MQTDQSSSGNQPGIPIGAAPVMIYPPMTDPAYWAKPSPPTGFQSSAPSSSQQRQPQNQGQSHQGQQGSGNRQQNSGPNSRQGSSQKQNAKQKDNPQGQSQGQGQPDSENNSGGNQNQQNASQDGGQQQQGQLGATAPPGYYGYPYMRPASPYPSYPPPMYGAPPAMLPQVNLAVPPMTDKDLLLIVDLMAHEMNVAKKSRSFAQTCGNSQVKSALERISQMHQRHCKMLLQHCQSGGIPTTMWS
ncbi:hypothetical protein GJ688_11020 [Heliobacillus mobilis]|uniref:Coat F domain-containing protein n=1 Tax=Heliobacterium mobile TaxID=28064 RepID=A0A6I3SKS5_HELMO|nr:hypothetical protein [Heliobacterium mobile]MTV49509.1 hypothetical protein [Heliobacterium mobile]